MPFLCVLQPAAEPRSPLRRFNTNPAFAEFAPQGHQWRVGFTAPTTTNAHSRKPDEPLIFLDGYLSNRSCLLEGLQGTACRSDEDAVLIGKYLASSRKTSAADLKGCIFLCVLYPHSDQIHLFRDRLGGRTGYWLNQGDTAAAASQAADLLGFLNRSFAPNPAFIASCFSLTSKPPVGHSAFEGIKEILPGETILLDRRGCTSMRKPGLASKNQPPEGAEEQSAEFRRLLTLSVDNSLRFSRSASSMLSGGMDSGPMTLIADQLLAQSGTAIQAVSWYLSSCPAADERQWVEMLAPLLQQPIRFFDGSAVAPFQEISKQQVSPEAPLWNPCRGMIERCYAIAAEQGCEVILNGNAGDLLYPERSWLFLDTLARSGLKAVLKDISWIARRHGWKVALRDPALRRLLARKLGVDFYRRLKRAHRPVLPPWLSMHARQHLVQDEWPPEDEAFGFLPHYRKVFGQAMAFGRAHEQPYALMHGLERRDPYQDEDLAAFMLSLPFSSSHFRDKSKFVARMASRDLLPETLWKKRRTGDLTPLISAGMLAHRDKIISVLAQRDSWKEWVQPAAVQAALEEKNPSGQQQLLVCQCLAYNLWLEHHTGTG
ncbi:MAG: hypothetical protein JJU31_08545 [Wenzhouxiangella sp.]|nr:hypothetical protein [Wenzhouxiangella sp.]TVR94714.1 MAG: asparagine synthetase B family protein [Wenzhouxiangellaceae bacterium]